jgi:hypothetical protein
MSRKGTLGVPTEAHHRAPQPILPGSRSFERVLLPLEHIRENPGGLAEASEIEHGPTSGPGVRPRETDRNPLALGDLELDSRPIAAGTSPVDASARYPVAGLEIGAIGEACDETLGICGNRAMRALAIPIPCEHRRPSWNDCNFLLIHNHSTNNTIYK